MCAETGLVLYETHQHRHHYPASLVKVMTALIVLENVNNLDETVIVSERAATLPWYAASMSLRAGDRMTVWEALHGILLPSANEVANALAEHVAGSIEAFIGMMNRRAGELGAVNTNFVNACGLPGEGQHTTAHDMSLIMREAVTHPEFVAIINTEFFDFPPSQRHPQGRTLRNTNRLVRHDDPLYSEWVVGGKTGWIIAARNTLTTYSVQDNRGLIITVLYTEDRAATFEDTIALLSYGFTMLADVPLPMVIQPREHDRNTPPQAANVIYLPVTGEEAYNEETEAEAPPPLVFPLDRLTEFARALVILLAVVAALAGAGVILLLVRKRKLKERA
jgi:D-alanyl-D-alanine carboxypeptidase